MKERLEKLEKKKEMFIKKLVKILFVCLLVQFLFGKFEVNANGMNKFESGLKILTSIRIRHYGSKIIGETLEQKDEKKQILLKHFLFAYDH